MMFIIEQSDPIPEIKPKPPSKKYFCDLAYILEILKDGSLKVCFPFFDMTDEEYQNLINGGGYSDRALGRMQGGIHEKDSDF